MSFFKMLPLTETVTAVGCMPSTSCAFAAQYAIEIGSKGFYTSMPGLSKFWQYFPVPLAGIAMIIFQLEALYEHIKLFFVDEEESGKEEKK